jgi:hypothetical protein
VRPAPIRLLEGIGERAAAVGGLDNGAALAGDAAMDVACRLAARGENVMLTDARLPDAVARAEAAGQQLVYYPLEDPLANAENPLMALMSGGGDEEKKAVKWERLTLAELEAKLAERKQNAVMSLVMPAGLSMFMKIHYLAASQVRAAPPRPPPRCARAHT